MTDTGWHAPADLLARFAADPARIDDVTASSVESHLVACPTCRSTLAGAAAVDVDASWAAVADRIDRSRPSLTERFLERLGVGGGLARLVAATPALRLSGLAAIAALAAAATVLSRTAGAEGPFLVLAPLVPLAAVAATFAPAADPAGEAGVATPLHGVGLAVRRSAVVLATTFAVLGVAALALPGVSLTSAAWTLPALALAVGALALSTWWRVEACVAGLALAWVATTQSAWLLEGRGVAVADTLVFKAGGQATALLLVLLATAVLAARSDRFATLEARS